MLLRIVAVAATLIALLIAVKDHRLLQRTHLVGACSTMSTAQDGTEWRSCTGGYLSGKPVLTRDSCTDAGPRGKNELWHCPASLVQNATR
jgi:hypothetical protein